MVAALDSTRLVDRADVGEFTVARRDGFEGSGGGVCLTTAAGETGCANFDAVGSFASVALDGQWYIVAVVPNTEPTTTFRTEPDLRFDAADG
ncbi:MAG TPA: hypothetical protein PLV68_15990, partial [Ilumatobacteraceae bacterium]|nr:hypothetical protein [Ilumatobacteraceae bacterium]